jgi:hypothetical protein
MAALENLVKSPEYNDAKRKVASWKQRLMVSDRMDALAIRDEKDEFFGKMRSSRPDLYAVFEVTDKSLSETIVKKVTGKDIIIG